MLYCINKDIGQDNLTLLAVGICQSCIWIKVIFNVDSFGLFFVYDILCRLCYPVVEIGLFTLQCLFSDFKFSQIKDHVEQILHAS